MRTSKFGAKIRKKVDKATTSKKQLYECRDCGKRKVMNISFSQWKCRSCDKHYAGGAYVLRTSAGLVAERMITENQ